LCRFRTQGSFKIIGVRERGEGETKHAKVTEAYKFHGYIVAKNWRNNSTRFRPDVRG
jgi:hypothetical protein